MTVPMIKSIGDVPYPIDTHSDAFSPLLTAGAALGITGDGPTTTAAWLERTSTSDGPTTAKCIHGNTVRWNQLVSDSDTSITVPSGHKYVARIDGTTTLATSDGTAITVTGGADNVFDLTAMFGAGSEPATIAEFESLYPLPYYEYDAGSLLSVNMEGIETVGFNQLHASGTDSDQYEGHYYIDGSGGGYAKTANSGYNCYLVPVFPSTEYCLSVDSGNIGQIANRRYLDAGKEFISGSVGGFDQPSYVFTTPANCRYIEIAVATTSTKNVCINLSWSGRRNGEYEAFWKSQRLIDVASYFPDGMRSAGTVRDELTATEAITRVGAVDLGTLTWTYSDSWHSWYTDTLSDVKDPGANTTVANLTHPSYEALSANYLINATDEQLGVGIATTSKRIVVRNGSSTVEPTGMLNYELATPTVTPIDPPLNLSYRVAAGGTERVMVPTGENSAPPTLVTAQGYTAESLRDAALSAIAPVENGLASANYGVGSYLVHGGQLCRVTTAIATGESITIGTNVVTTTVMAEVIALTQ